MPSVAIARVFAAGLLLAGVAPAVAAGDGALGDLGGYVFVANRTAAEIAVIEVERDAVVSRVALAGVPAQFVISEPLRKLAASHPAARAVSIADLERGGFEVLRPGLVPEQLQIDPAGRVLAISSSREGRVVLVSLATGEILHDVGWPWQPGDLLFDRDGERLLVASRGQGRIAVLEVATGAVREQIRLRAEGGVLPGIVNLVATPGGQYGFALHGQGGQVSVLDLRSLAVLAVLALPGPAIQAFPTANAQYVLVPNARDRSVSMISTWSFRESSRLPGAAKVAGINPGMFDSVAFLLDGEHQSALILDLDRRQQAGELALDARPGTAVAAAGGTRLYVALTDRDAVAVIDLGARRLVKLIEGVGKEPWAVSGTGGLSYCH